MNLAVMELKKFERFEFGGKVYEVRHEPFQISGFVYITGWDIEMPRGTKSEIRIPAGTVVRLVGMEGE